MKGEFSGVVGPVFAGAADPFDSGFIASLARPGGRRWWANEILDQATPGTTALQAYAGRVRPFQ
jgi:hypothetical protein